MLVSAVGEGGCGAVPRDRTDHLLLGMGAQDGHLDFHTAPELGGGVCGGGGCRSTVSPIISTLVRRYLYVGM